MLFLLSGSLAGCAGPPESQVLAVFAASSLTEVIGDLEGGFEEMHPELDIRGSFAGSQVLRLQIEQGAPADVLVSANEEHVRALLDSGLVSESRVVAHTELVLVVPSDNPAGIRSFEDLPRARRVVMATREVPAGAYAHELLERAGERYGPEFVSTVLAHLVSEEASVRLVRAKVELGEADAAFVYRSDALGCEALEVIEIPVGLSPRVDYHLGVVTGSMQAPGLDAWLDYMSSAEGKDVFAQRGFGTL